MSHQNPVYNTKTVCHDFEGSLNEVLIVNDMMKPHTRQVYQSLNSHEIHPFASFVSMVKFQLLFVPNNIVFPLLITENEVWKKVYCKTCIVSYDYHSKLNENLSTKKKEEFKNVENKIYKAK